MIKPDEEYGFAGLIKAGNEAVRSLKEKGLTVTFMESCTGGLLAASVTSVPGASDVFKGSLVTYSNGTKTGMGKVPEAVINEYTAVSENTAVAMAESGREIADADICISVTGNAGPDPSEGKPVGLVYIGTDTAKGSGYLKLELEGERNEIRMAAALTALRVLRRLTEEI